MSMLPENVKPMDGENVEHYVKRVGHDENFEPTRVDVSIAAKTGTLSKILRLRFRVENSMELWVEGDAIDKPTIEEEEEAAKFCTSNAKDEREKRYLERGLKTDCIRPSRLVYFGKEKPCQAKKRSSK